MDWSATLSLTTSKARQHRANYGSFSSSTSSLSRHGSSTTISIPESIPEHQCVDKFPSPRLKHAELQIVDHVESECTSSNGSRWFTASSTTVTLTETSSSKTSSLNTFRMLLTSAHSVTTSTTTSTDHRINEPPTSADHASSYWLQERERMMLERKHRYLRQNGSPTKAASLRSETGSSGYRTAMIMCSVPLVLVLVFVIVVLVFGDDAGAAASRSFLRASVESPRLEDTTS